MENEKTIERLCLEFLDIKGCFPFKIESTGTFDPKIRKFRKVTSPYKRKGVSDIVFFWKEKVWFCEIKKPEALGYIKRNVNKLKQRQVPSRERESNQIEFLETVKTKNQIGILVSSLDELKYLMELPCSSVPLYLESSEEG